MREFDQNRESVSSFSKLFAGATHLELAFQLLGVEVHIYFMLFARHAIILVGNLFKGMKVSFGFMEMVHRMLNTSLFVVVIRLT